MTSSQLMVMYESGQLPCHVTYHLTKLKLDWQHPLGAEGIYIIHTGIEFQLILPALFEGLVETQHPYCFIAQQGIKDLLQTSVEFGIRIDG